MYYLPENFGYEHRGLVVSNKHVNSILQQKNMKRKIMSLRDMAISKIPFGMLLIV